MDLLHPVRYGVDAVMLVALAIIGWMARRVVTSIDGKMGRAEHEQDMKSVHASLSRKAEQKDLDNHFVSVKDALASVDVKLNLILSQMIRK